MDLRYWYVAEKISGFRELSQQVKDRGFSYKAIEYGSDPIAKRLEICGGIKALPKIQ